MMYDPAIPSPDDLQYLVSQRQQATQQLLSINSLSPGSTPSIPGRRSHVLDTVGRHQYLSDEIQNQFGGNARAVIYEQYGPRSPKPPERGTRLIDKVLQTRAKDFTRSKEVYQDQIRDLNQERQKLLQDQQRVHELRTTAKKSQKQPKLTGRYDIEVQRSPSASSVHSVNSIIRDTARSLPAYTSRCRQLRQQIAYQHNRLRKPYNGELGPHSYQPWQMEHYHMVRGLVEQLVDRCLDKYYRQLPPALNMETAQALKEADQLSWERQKHAVLQSRVIQLIMEEIVLEISGSLTRETVEEFLHICQIAKSNSDRAWMLDTEAVAMGNPEGRDMEDPAFNLVTKSFLRRQIDRDTYRKPVWGHTQFLKLLEAGDDDDDDDEDVELITFYHVSPMHLRQLTARPKDSPAEKLKKEWYARYLRREREYWKNMTTELTEVSFSKSCRGIQMARLSHDHRCLAVGTTHGDLIVYDLHKVPYSPLWAVHKKGKGLDPIIDIAWSLDSQQLTTTSKAGVLHYYALRPGDKSKKDAKELDLRLDGSGFVPTRPTSLLRMDVSANDFKFQAGPLSQQSAQKASPPSAVVFYPSVTLSGNQPTFCVAQDNGDITRCDCERNLQPTEPDENWQPSPRILQPEEQLNPEDPDLIGQGVEAYLCRQHKRPIILLGCIDNMQEVFSVDQKGYINIWKFTETEMSTHGWFRPLLKYKLDMTKTMYKESTTVQPTVIFTDRAQGKKRNKSRQQISRERRQAQRIIDTLDITHPWHEDLNEKEKLKTQIYAPKEEVTPGGAVFHVITRRISTDVLSTYLTRLYLPFQVKATRLVSCHLTPDGSTLVFLLLFPEYEPKGPHLTVVMVDLHTMEALDFRLDIPLTADQYLQCQRDDIICSHVGRQYGPTGAAYFFMNFGGVLSGYSLNTGTKVLQTKGPGISLQDFTGCVPNIKELAQRGGLLVAGMPNTMDIITHTNEQRYKKLLSQLTVLHLVDKNSDEDRRAMTKTFTMWEDRPPLLPTEQRVNLAEYPLEDDLHPAIAVRMLILDLVDYIMEKKSQPFSDEQRKEIAALDRVTSYKAILPEIDVPPREDEDAAAAATGETPPSGEQPPPAEPGTSGAPPADQGTSGAPPPAPAGQGTSGAPPPAEPGASAPAPQNNQPNNNTGGNRDNTNRQ